MKTNSVNDEKSRMSINHQRNEHDEWYLQKLFPSSKGKFSKDFWDLHFPSIGKALNISISIEAKPFRGRFLGWATPSASKDVNNARLCTVSKLIDSNQFQRNPHCERHAKEKIHKTMLQLIFTIFNSEHHELWSSSSSSSVLLKKSGFAIVVASFC